MKTKSKAAKVLDILFIIDAIIIIYYSTTFPTDRFDLLSIIVMAVLILALLYDICLKKQIPHNTQSLYLWNCR